MPTVEVLVQTFETNYNLVNTRDLAKAIHDEVASGTLSVEALKTHLTSLFSTRYMHGVNDALRHKATKDAKPSTSKVTKSKNPARL